MKRFIITGIILASIPFSMFAQTISSQKGLTTVTLQSPGLTPTDFFYFLDRFGEEMNSFFTFRAESKVRLAFLHAEERAAEIHAVLKVKGLESREAKEAKERFDQEIAKAIVVVVKEKMKGRDIKSLIQVTDGQLEVSKDMLKEAYRQYYEDLKEREADLRAGGAVVGAAVGATFEGKLKHLKNEQYRILKEKDDVEEDFDEKRDRLDKTMGDEQSAASHIKNAEKSRAQLVALAKVRGMGIHAQSLADFDVLLGQAKISFAAGDFEDAKEYANDAREILKDEKESLDMRDYDGDAKESAGEGGAKEKTEGRATGENKENKKSIEFKDDTLEFEDDLDVEIEGMLLN